MRFRPQDLPEVITAIQDTVSTIQSHTGYVIGFASPDDVSKHAKLFNFILKILIHNFMHFIQISIVTSTSDVIETYLFQMVSILFSIWSKNYK